MCRTTSFLFDAVGTLCNAVRPTSHDPVSDLEERRLKGEWDGPDAFILQSVPPLSFLISFKRPQNPRASLSLPLYQVEGAQHMRGGRKGKVLSLRNLGESIYNPPGIMKD